jgi:hypothetical protein
MLTSWSADAVGASVRSLFELALNSGVVADREQLILAMFRKRRSLLEQGDRAAAESVSAGLASLAVQQAPAR